MAVVSFSKCCKYGLYVGSGYAVISFLGNKKVSHSLISGISCCVGVASGNYVVRNNEFFNGWKESAKTIAFFAFVFFTIAIFWSGATLFDKTINLQETLADEARILFIVCLFNCLFN